MMNEKQKLDVKQMTRRSSMAALKQYARLTVGSDSMVRLMGYELIMTFCSGLFGCAGLAMRRYFYRFVFLRMGKNVSIGRNVTIRGGNRISIGDNVMIDDNCVLDARGEDSSIQLGNGVLLSGSTVIRSRNAEISIGSGCSIGRNCLLGSDSRLVVGDEVLLGAYTYLCAGGLHRFEGPEVSILSQGVDNSKGIVVSKGVWLGTRTTVLDGVTVGQGTVVGAHSLVNRSLPPMIVAYGSPAKVVRERGNNG